MITILPRYDCMPKIQDMTGSRCICIHSWYMMQDVRSRKKNCWQDANNIAKPKNETPSFVQNETPSFVRCRWIPLPTNPWNSRWPKSRLCLPTTSPDIPHHLSAAAPKMLPKTNLPRPKNQPKQPMPKSTSQSPNQAKPASSMPPKTHYVSSLIAAGNPPRLLPKRCPKPPRSFAAQNPLFSPCLGSLKPWNSSIVVGNKIHLQCKAMMLCIIYLRDLVVRATPAVRFRLSKL